MSIYQKPWRTEMKNEKPAHELKLDKLCNNLNQCDNFLENINDVLKKLKDLETLYGTCSSKTNSLHEACENIVQQQHALIVAADVIDETMSYFSELEQISIKLKNPSPLILTDSLSPTLNRLDECIAFMQTKRDKYKEAPYYLEQYTFLLSQALNTVANHVKTSIQQTAKSVTPSSDANLDPEDSVFTLFYGKFQENASRVKTLMALIENRLDKDEKYVNLYNDVQSSYFAVRDNLIGPVFTVALEDMVNSHARNYCSLMRNSTKMLMHICRDEYQLYFQFFGKLDDRYISSLHDYLRNLTYRLYNCLRPIIIQISHFETLSELCIFIKAEVIDEHTTNSDELHAFGSVIEQLLQDIQERLAYRSNIYVYENIVGYKPAPGDLAYPEKLEMMEGIAESLMATSGSGLSRSASVASGMSGSALSDISLVSSDRPWDRTVVPSGLSSSPADIHGMWFPTVRRTILCLSKLYRALDRPTFQGLSQDIVAACLESLQDAANKISKKKSPLDGTLFLIKHLLIVREQIAPFHIECTFREVNVDLNRVKSAALDLIQKRESLFSLTNSNGLLRFLFEFPGATSVIDEVFDPQKIVDSLIRQSCQEFIAVSTEYLGSKLMRFLMVARAALKIDSTKLRGQSFASIGNLSDSVKQMIDQLKETLPPLKRKMSIYLSNDDTQNILLKPVKLALCRQFDELIKLIAVNYSADEKNLIQCPTKDEIEQIILNL
ncbi:Conserved oligomeric Golgi complex subunit 3 [Halotydeus destructor]|nr:Conserved oligomeric Golgi complex subunit 3 [Halotydeus destructor]